MVRGIPNRCVTRMHTRSVWRTLEPNSIGRFVMRVWKLMARRMTSWLNLSRGGVCSGQKGGSDAIVVEGCHVAVEL